MTALSIALLAGPVLSYAQGTQGQTQTQTQTPPPQTQTQDPQKPPTYKESVVVSASKTEQQIVAAPATMTVIGERSLSLAPSNSYSDVLRSVPGLNITQISARDINVSSRAATGSLATSQLALLDGRSLYQDFFGFTMWDFMPANLDEIKRIEVIRGPASAVWGANALTGVVNILTKSPREMAGTSVAFGIGTFNRDVPDAPQDNGMMFFVRGTHAQVVNDRWSYKFSAGMIDYDAFARPVGEIPNDTGTNYPPYTNQGTSQPKFDGRVDYDFADGVSKLQFSGGTGGTDGIMHTGIGPFDIQRGTTFSYGKVNYLRGNFRLQGFLNVLNGDANSLLSVDPTGTPIDLLFNTKTFDLEAGNMNLLAGKHVLTYGGNFRVNLFDITITPGEDGRNEGGAYVQDEFLLSSKFRLVAGARVDKFSSIDDAVFSPRVALVMMPKPDQSIRVTYNRAFRAPSLVNNNLDITVATALPLGAISPAFGNAVFYVPTDANGNTGLSEERVDSFEVAYTATIRDRATVTAAYYYTNFTDSILFTQDSSWGRLEPPPGFPGLGPIPPVFIWAGVYDAGFVFPKAFTYKNLGEVKQQGFELGVEGSITDHWGAYVNYAFQADPKPAFPGLTEEQALSEINIPAQNLFNAGVSYISDRLFGTFTVAYSDSAFWQDVLDARFHGTTEPYTIVSLTAGMKFSGGRYAASLKITNLLNDEVQQHIFGDVLKRQVMGEFKINFPR
jgi:iron complex outermembrane receptor protein